MANVGNLKQTTETVCQKYCETHCKNSLIYTQDVTDASVNTCCKLKLVFQFSGRQYFEIRRGFYIKLKVSLLREFLWCMSQTSCDENNSLLVRTHEKTQEKLFADWAQ